MRTLAAVLSLLVPVLGLAQISEHDFLEGPGDVAYLLLPPQPVAGDVVAAASWASNGQAVSAIRTIFDWSSFEGVKPTPKGQAVVVWNRKTGRSSEVHRTGPTGRVTGMEWLKDSDLLFFTTEEVLTPEVSRHTLFRSSATGASAVAVRQSADPAISTWSLFASPYAPVAVLLEQTTTTAQVGGPVGTAPVLRQRAVLTVVRGNGTVSNGVPLEPGQLPYAVMFRPDGRARLMGTGEFDLELDTRTGVILSPGRNQEPHQRASDPEHPFEIGRVAIHGQGTPPSTMAVLRAGGKQAVIGADLEFVEISPTSDAVLTISRGLAAVRPIATVSKRAMDDARKAAQRALALSNAKQAGLALLIYAADYDDELPAPSPQFKDQINPYLKNNSVIESFTYTFAGGNLKSIQKPAETVLGYVTGPGGRAMVYADGHAVWIDD